MGVAAPFEIAVAWAVRQAERIPPSGHLPRTVRAPTWISSRNHACAAFFRTAQTEDLQSRFLLGRPPYNAPGETIEIMHRATAEVNATGIEDPR